jgi:hypothetical protein
MKNGNQDAQAGPPSKNDLNIGSMKPIPETNPTINLRCENCTKVYQVRRTKDIPETTKWISSNWCPKCEDDACDYYKETFMDFDEFYEQDPNQLKIEL